MGILIVDGPDRAGKTTLVNSLRMHSKRPCIVVHNGPPTRMMLRGGSEAAHFGMLSQYALEYDMALGHHHECDFIFDRAHPSEFVLGHLYRKGPSLEDSIVVEMERMLLRVCRENDVPAEVVIVLGDAQTILDRDDGKSTWSHADPQQALARLETEMAMFMRYAEMSRLPLRAIQPLNAPIVKR